MSKQDGNPSSGHRVRLASGLIVAVAMSVPVMGAFQPASAATIRSAPGDGTAHRTALPATMSKTGGDRPVEIPGQRLGEAAVAIARAQTGKPYVWGAEGPNAFDCSGLVQWSYRKIGIRLPRVTYAQYRRVQHKVAWSKLTVGDLVFFNGRSHVGIVSKRKGAKLWMIHAPYTGSYVQQVRLDGYRRQTFAGAVRPF